MKRVYKVIIGVAIAFVLIITAIFYFTSGMTDTANAFFQAIKSQDVAKARNYLSEDFKASTDEAALKDFLTKGALLKFKDTNWSNRQVGGGRGELDGEVITDTGGVVPLKLMFIKENGKWKIYGIQKPTAGLQVEQTTPNIPNKADQAKLIKNTFENFAISVNNKDMSHFYSTIAQLWKNQVKASEFNDVFGEVYGSDLTVFGKINPTFKPATQVGENGEIVLIGYFPNDPKKFHFKLTYVYEGISWKVIGLKFNANDEPY